MIPKNTLSNLIELTCAIQQIPAPTFQEQIRADFVFQKLKEIGITKIFKDETGNVIAYVPGGPARPVLVSAHLDTVHPIDHSLPLTRLNDRLIGPGIGDNSLGVAGLVALADIFLHSEPLPGDLILVANIAEEGLGDLKGIKAVVDTFGSTPLAYLALEGMGLGEIHHRGLGVDRFRAEVICAGGHSWVNFGRPSAVHVLAALITRLTSMEVSQQPRSTFNVGKIQGGTSINTIAAQASAEIDLRSEDPAALSQMVKTLHEFASEFDHPESQITLTPIGHRPPGEIPASHPLVKLAETCLQEQGLPAKLEIASTDANMPLSRGYPALCVGLTYGEDAHSDSEFFDIEPLEKGLAAAVNLIRGVWDLPA
jgi:tripeptide aminopeptidase